VQITLNNGSQAHCRIKGSIAGGQSTERIPCTTLMSFQFRFNQVNVSRQD